MHTEKRAEERSVVIKKQSDILLVNKGVDLSDQKDVPPKRKLKLILPGSKIKKIREASNDSNDANSVGGKLKIKTNRKEKKFIINSLKKNDDSKNLTIIPRRNMNENLAKANTIKDRRLKS